MWMHSNWMFMKCSFFNDRLYPRNDSICYHDVFISSTKLYFWCNKRTKKKFTPPSSARSIVIVSLAIINHLIIDLKLNDHHHHHHNHQTPSQATADEIQKEMSERQKNEPIQKRHTHTQTAFLDTYIPSGRHHRIMVVNWLLFKWECVCNVIQIKKREKNNSYVNRFSRCKSIYCFCFLFFFLVR